MSDFHSGLHNSGASTLFTQTKEWSVEPGKDLHTVKNTNDVPRKVLMMLGFSPCPEIGVGMTGLRSDMSPLDILRT